MGPISPGGQNLLDLLELRQVLSTYDGDLRDPLSWPQKRPVPMRVERGPLMIPRILFTSSFSIDELMGAWVVSEATLLGWDLNP